MHCGIIVINKYAIGGLLNVENEMKKLCIDMIHLLDTLKQKGFINDEEYEKLTYEKKKFLKTITKQQNV